MSVTSTIHESSTLSTLRGRKGRVAVVGGGISGLAAAHALQSGGCEVTLYEAAPRLGGHARTVPVTLPDVAGGPVTHGVDVGFLVFNERTYPGLIALFAELGVETAASDMSFSVQAPRGLDGRSRRLEWAGASLDTVFAQRRNLLSPRFLWMLREILRFNRLATGLAVRSDDAALAQPLGDFLERNGFGADFSRGYLLPMIACIWSCPLDRMLRFPVATLVRFCHNHGLLQVNDRPAWRTVRGGSSRYVEAIARGLADVRLADPVHRIDRVEAAEGGVRVQGASGSLRFDAVVLACHAPAALGLMGDGALAEERAVLSALRTQPNRAVLHTDEALMPRARRAWAAWNFEQGESRADAPADAAPVCLHYWINRLQPLPFGPNVFVTLNPVREPRAFTVLGEFEFDHPVFDGAAIEAQRALAGIQGRGGLWWAGAWCGHGFHEDGLQAGRRAAQGVLAHLAARASAGAAGPPEWRRAA